jgi:putative ABC transport system permease protein
MLGIIIGVSSVILLTGIGGGTTKAITDQISTMGTRLVTVNLNRRGSTRSVDYEELGEYVEDNPEFYLNITPYITGFAQAKLGSENFQTSLDACNAQYESIKNVEIINGRFISDYDCENRSYGAVVGTYIQKELFGGMNPVGETIKLNGKQFKIIGVYEEAGDSTENSQDNKVTIPYTTAMRFLKNKTISTYYLEASDEEVVDMAVSSVKSFLTKKFGADSGFTVTSVSAIIDTMNEIMGMMTTMLAGIAAISLIVGGIGVMNIMTVSVSERTREIGIRKAIGARTTDILLQFLIESILLSAIGGLIGILLGIGLGPLVKSLLGIEFAVQMNMVIISFAFSAAIGVFFGIAPAKKAAKLHPIEALRAD